MYSQLLFFIIALLLLTVQQPGAHPFTSPLPTLLLCAAIFGCYILICRHVLLRLERAYSRDYFVSLITLRFHRAQTHLSILALLALFCYTFIFNIKYYLNQIPGFQSSTTLPGMTGLGLYLLHLVPVWFWGYTLYRRIHRSSLSRSSYIKGQIAFNFALLIPWLLVSALLDALQFLQLPGFLNTDTGDLLLSAAAMVLLVLFAPRLIVRLWGCEPLPDSSAREEIEEFCRDQRFHFGNLLLWPLLGGEMLTAGIVGVLPKWRYILVTRGLLALLDNEELKAVTAHEMGHVRRFHIPFLFGFFFCYIALLYSFSDLVWLFFLKHEIPLQWATSEDSLYLTLFSILCVIPVLVLLVVYFRYIFGFFLRNCERQADAYALQVIGHPYTLISSLEKIAVYSGQTHDLPSWHHFSIRQRIDFLLRAYKDRDTIRRHNRKLYGSAFLLILIVITSCMAGLKAKNMDFARQWRRQYEIHVIGKELAKGTSNPKLYAAYGNLSLELGHIEEAESALTKALAMAPEDATILNNLAWLYATSPPPHFKPRRALQLASEAAQIEPAPHTLDTLAEAYFVNGRFPEALAAIDLALERKPLAREYYLQQKEKFLDALNGGRNGEEIGGDHPPGQE
jgi:Zn-dependent protease with chaperone function